MVRAKFRVTKVTTTCYGAAQPDSTIVSFSAVSDDANKTWSKWTPSGELQMQINNPAALEQFKIGEFYFLDFTPAPPKEADEAKST
jgi:hypothetical protein